MSESIVDDSTGPIDPNKPAAASDPSPNPIDPDFDEMDGMDEDSLDDNPEE